jgi:hypothetical protein
MHKVFNNPQEAWNQVKGYLEQLMAWFFDSIAQGPIGKYLFKDAADDMRRKSKIAAGASIVEERHAALKKAEEVEKGGGKKMSDADRRELTQMREIITEARAAQAEELKSIKWDKDAATKAAKEKFTKQGLNPDEKIQVNGLNGTRLEFEIMRMREDFNKSGGMRESTIKKLYENKFSEEELIRIFKLGFPALQNIPGKASGTLGTTGKLVQDFGTESLVKLHGNEAVLTEDQLANMAKGMQQSSSGSSPDGMKFIAEGLINLNKQTAVSNKLLGEVVEYNRRLLDKSTRNRLLTFRFIARLKDLAL